MDLVLAAVVVLVWLTVIGSLGLGLVLWARVATQRAVSDARARIAMSGRMKDVRRGKKLNDEEAEGLTSLERIMLGMAEGAGIDVDALLAGDPAAMAKAQEVFSKVKPGGAGGEKPGDFM